MRLFPELRRHPTQCKRLPRLATGDHFLPREGREFSRRQVRPPVLPQLLLLRDSSRGLLLRLPVCLLSNDGKRWRTIPAARSSRRKSTTCGQVEQWDPCGTGNFRPTRRPPFEKECRFRQREGRLLKTTRSVTRRGIDERRVARMSTSIEESHS
jgi:hypothetical protein